MAIKSYKVGPGSLTFNAGAQVASAQVTKAAVTPSEAVKGTDAIPVLSGEELPAEETADLSYKLDASVLQDIDAAGFVAFSWDHAGEEVTFAYVPNTVEDRQVSGIVRVVPLTIGGDVDVRNTADFSWSCIGTPVFGAAP